MRPADLMGIMTIKDHPILVINSSLVTDKREAQLYEFVLGEDLRLLECAYVESVSNGVVVPLRNEPWSLRGLLFELNHVRVNPLLDNTKILSDFSVLLENSGVYVSNPPSVDLMAMCFKPLGELSNVVRFYVTIHRELVFLSSSVKLRRVK